MSLSREVVFVGDCGNVAGVVAGARGTLVECVGDTACMGLSGLPLVIGLSRFFSTFSLTYSLRGDVCDGTLTRIVVPWSEPGVSMLLTLVGGVGTGPKVKSSSTFLEYVNAFV